MSLKDIFEVLSDFFTREKIEYGIIGAYALYAYGYVRATKDIDFITRLENQSKVVAFLESLGFETIACSSAFSNHTHIVGSVKIDIMYVENSTADSIFQVTKRSLIFKDLSLPVVSFEHLIAMKLFAHQNNPERMKDLSDIEEICKRTEHDEDSIKKYFVKYGQEKFYYERIKKRN